MIWCCWSSKFRKLYLNRSIVSYLIIKSYNYLIKQKNGERFVKHGDDVKEIIYLKYALNWSTKSLTPANGVISKKSTIFCCIQEGVTKSKWYM